MDILIILVAAASSRILWKSWWKNLDDDGDNYDDVNSDYVNPKPPALKKKNWIMFDDL